MLEYWPTELGASWISLAEVEREVKNGAKAHLYFIRDSQGDPDEDLACRRGDSDENLGPVVHSVGNGGNLKGDSGPMNGSSKEYQRNLNGDSDALVLNSMETRRDLVEDSDAPKMGSMENSYGLSRKMNSETG